MARYIDKEFLLAWLENIIKTWIVKTIDSEEHFPSADVVEVVRCEKCKYFMEYNEDYVGKVEKAVGDCYLLKMYSCDPQFCAVKSDDFCSYGKRKGD